MDFVLYFIVDDMTIPETGYTNPTMNTDELNEKFSKSQQSHSTSSKVNLKENNDEREVGKDSSNDDDSVDEAKDGENTTGCGTEFHFSIMDSEYDETLAFPDSVTILSNVGEKPVLVERKDTDEDDDDADGLAEGQLCPKEIPFTAIYAPNVKFNSFQRKVFIPCAEIQVRIVDTDRSVTTHLINPNL